MLAIETLGMAESQPSDKVENELWADRKPSYTEAMVINETAMIIDDVERDVDEIMAVCEASAISAMETLKA